MARKCENCEIVEKYKYWNELPPTKHHFFKIMPQEFEHQMHIPKKFMECFKGVLSSWCTLVGPSENKWRVGVSRAEEDPDRTVFLNGWDDFVRDHGIQFRDFLEFHYIGESTFKVLIFDASGCEREGSYFVKNGSISRISCTSILHAGKIFRGYSEDVGGGAYRSESSVAETARRSARGKKRTPDSVIQLDSEPEVHSDDETKETSRDLSSEEEPVYQYRPFMMIHNRKRQSKRAKISQMFFISNRRKLKEGEEQRAAKKAESHIPPKGVPAVWIPMTPTHVYRGFNMTIPKRWAIEHMLHETHEVKLQVPSEGSSWTVGCRWTSGKQCQLRANWPAFVFDNKLEEYDVCVFELVKKAVPDDRVAVISVYIYRVVEEAAGLTVSRRMV